MIFSSLGTWGRSSTNYKFCVKEFAEGLQEEVANIHHLCNNPRALRGVPTGLLDVEKVLNGLHKSDLILLAACPSMGKTALALNIAANAAKRDKVIALFSLEMNVTQITQRFLRFREQSKFVSSEYGQSFRRRHEQNCRRIGRTFAIEYIRWCYSRYFC